ncbi:ABC transporter ATP-binding protein [Flavitalea sp. BT771]|uniref:ABC transporter ATP-binding protein n=1 Tax=Flavitalea sp. BT771 TaxID=3063329 RepID=UPI0026E272E3|nr:ABC transporter ATP-binding protein [Flavitalea sp. BT771]MDO6429411.1 ABC transporter ATP-binding protein [Flavitalea sp. BT771]MDV6218461.1 ABC transporter ATP-binding protein [Flavitalea sp. BT771]
MNHFENLSDKNILWALDNISFEVRQGEAMGIIGHNGAGKSTILKILSKITEPTFGEARVRGRISSLLEIGTGFHPDLTGRDNIYMNGTILGMTKREIDRKLDQIIHFSGVEKHVDTLLKFYSSGMKVRLGFSVAAYLEQEIIMVDEVLAVGDADFQKKCLRTMEDVSSQGRTTLFISHDLGAIQTLCKRSILMQNGKLIRDGDSATLVKEYLESTDNMRRPLNMRVDRTGKGEVTFSDIILVDNKTNKATNTVISGSDISFLLYYKSHQVDYIYDMEIEIDISNQNRGFITSLNNRMTHKCLRDLPGEGVVECNIEKFPLLSGKYRIDIYLNINGGYCDGIKDVLFLEVINFDQYKSGFGHAQGRGGVLMQQQWKIRE